MTENTEQPKPTLHPLYVPAQADTWIKIEFVGNTPVVAGYGGSSDLTPYHMLAAAEDMKRKAFQMMQFAEIEEAKARQKQEAMGIQTPGDVKVELPPGGFKVGG
jgi:hypothetical protein